MRVAPSPFAVEGFSESYKSSFPGNIISPMAGVISVKEIPEDQFTPDEETYSYVITLASYVFRLVALLHVKPTQEILTTYNCSPEQFDDAMAERANLCCGAFSRDLGRYFPHIGMSTPFKVPSQCADFMGELRPQAVFHYEIELPGNAKIQASLGICAYAAVDFTREKSSASADQGVMESFGELELF